MIREVPSKQVPAHLKECAVRLLLVRGVPGYPRITDLLAEEGNHWPYSMIGRLCLMEDGVGIQWSGGK